MTTVNDILNGNYCKNGASDCTRWDIKADCCMADNIAGRLYSTMCPAILECDMEYEERI